MQLVQFPTDDELKLNGLFCDARSQATIIHVHGKCGNFYENKFVRLMMDAYPRAGFNFLSFNNRGTACYTEAVRAGQTTYIGTAIEEFTECLYDLSAAIRYARSFGPRVILQGHSFGCEKLMYFAQKADPAVELVLLSPSDGYRLQEIFIAPESVEEQLHRIVSRYELAGMEWLAPAEYGIRGPGVEYHVPITAKALVELIRGPAFELLRLGKAWTCPQLANRSFVYVGEVDALQVEGAPAMAKGIRERFANAKILVQPDGRHDLGPHQEKVIAEIIEWAKLDPGRCETAG